MNNDQILKLIHAMTDKPCESEWVEFKHNFHSPDEIGERISALSNSACLHNKPFGYLVFGIEDNTQNIIGTTFQPRNHKAKGNEDLIPWLVRMINPKIDFQVYETHSRDDKKLIVFVIPAAKAQPVDFQEQAYIRIGSYTQKLKNHPDKQAKIWKGREELILENVIVKENLSASDVIQLLNTPTYFELLKLPYPSNQETVIEKMLNEGFIKSEFDGFHISMLGALVLAKNLEDFDGLARKAIRVIVYKGINKIETIREQIGKKGYAVGFESLIDWVNSQLPANEEIGRALRTDTRMYPEISIREIIANALIHQDFSIQGFPMIEVFSNRVEISNPGHPLITPDRFIDEYYSRNEKLADILRRMGICEEKGSGIDKVFFHNELYQLPPIKIDKTEKRTRITLYGYKVLNDLDKEERIRACYQHACLCYVSDNKMTNQSLRKRFEIEEQNSATASRIIQETLKAGKIKDDDPSNNSKKYKKYVPFWS